MNEIEDIFFSAIREVFSSDYFDYRIIYEMELCNKTSYRMAIIMNKQESPFTLELKKVGVYIDFRMLEFVLYYKEGKKRNIKMIVSSEKERLIIIPVFNTFGELVLGAYSSRSTNKISKYLINYLKNVYGKQ